MTEYWMDTRCPQKLWSIGFDTFLSFYITFSFLYLKQTPKSLKFVSNGHFEQTLANRDQLFSIESMENRAKRQVSISIDQIFHRHQLYKVTPRRYKVVVFHIVNQSNLTHKEDNFCGIFAFRILQHIKRCNNGCFSDM